MSRKATRRRAKSAWTLKSLAPGDKDHHKVDQHGESTDGRNGIGEADQARQAEHAAEWAWRTGSRVYLLVAGLVAAAWRAAPLGAGTARCRRRRTLRHAAVGARHHRIGTLRTPARVRSHLQRAEGRHLFSSRQPRSLVARCTTAGDAQHLKLRTAQGHDSIRCRNHGQNTQAYHSIID